MRFRLALMLLAVVSAAAEIRDVVKSAEIDKLLAGTERDRALHERPNFAIWLQVQDRKPGSYEMHHDADEVIFVRRGAAKVVVGEHAHQIGAGDVIHVPRRTPRRIDPGGGRFEYVSVRIFPTGENLPPRQGFLAPRIMPEVVKNAEIEATLAKFSSNQPLHSARNFTMNYVIYAGRSGPWEAHRGCVDIYFVRSGTARAFLGGEIQNAKEESPGEIRGAAVKGAKTYDIGAGDIVVIPRKGAHHMQPSGEKLGYLLIKVWAE